MNSLQRSPTEHISIILPNQPVPILGPLDLQVTISGTVNVSAEQARRKVNRFIHRGRIIWLLGRACGRCMPCSTKLTPHTIGLTKVITKDSNILWLCDEHRGCTHE